MTEKRYKAIPEVVSYKDIVTGEVLCPKCEKDYYKLLDLLNENEQLKQQIKYLRITVKSVINDLKRMDTYRYAEHLEKITNLRFVSEKELQE